MLGHFYFTVDMDHLTSKMIKKIMLSTAIKSFTSHHTIYSETHDVLTSHHTIYSETHDLLISSI